MDVVGEAAAIAGRWNGAGQDVVRILYTGDISAETGTCGQAGEDACHAAGVAIEDARTTRRHDVASMGQSARNLVVGVERAFFGRFPVTSASGDYF